MEAAGQGLGCQQENEQARVLQTELKEGSEKVLGKDGMGVLGMTQPHQLGIYRENRPRSASAY